MTVKTLIEFLQQLPEGAEVVTVDGQDIFDVSLLEYNPTDNTVVLK